jgi:DNA-binding transcriptional regulator YdaS (Cro superfamily)
MPRNNLGMNMTRYQALKKAINLAGSQGKLGRLLGVSQQCVNLWLLRDRSISATHALDCQIKLKGAVSAHDLRPDMYPRSHVKFIDEV